jgi:hypothetical protein
MAKTQKRVPLKILTPPGDNNRPTIKAHTTAFFDTYTDSAGKEWVILPVKIKQIGSNDYQNASWETDNRFWQTYVIEPLEITFLNGIETKNSSKNFSLGGGKITIRDLELCQQDQHKKVKNPQLYLNENAQVNFCLGSEWILEEDGDYQKEGINDTFNLVVKGDYKVANLENNRILINFVNQTFREAQPYLEQKYPSPQKAKSVDLSGQWLKGPLNLNQFTNLEVLNLTNNQISELQVDKCLKLKNLDVRQNNKLTKLTVNRLNQFERLKADTGELKKSAFFGGRSEWEATNIGDLNTAPLRIIQTNEENEGESVFLSSLLNQVTIYGVQKNNSEYSGIIKTLNEPEEEQKKTLNQADFARLKREIIDKVITPDFQNWTIQEEFNADNSAKIIFIIFGDTKLKRDSRNRIVPKIGKVHFKNGFTEEEWKEIKNLLKTKKITAKFQCQGKSGSSDDDGYFWLFISEDGKYKIEIHEKNPALKNWKPPSQQFSEEDLKLYKITWSISEKDKKFFGVTDYILVKELKEQENTEIPFTPTKSFWKKPETYFWGTVVLVGVLLVVLVVRKIFNFH